MIAVLCLAAAAAIVVSRIRNQSARRIVVIVSAAGLLMDGWPVPLALASDPGMQITHGNAVARLGLPLEGNETETMYGAIAQGRPVFNGYSGYTAPQHYALGDLLDRGDPRILERLASGGPIEIIVRHRLDPRGRWRAFVASYPGARISDETAGWTAFQIPATPAGQERTAIASMLTIAHLEASVDNRDVNAIIDGDLDTRWHAERQSGAESIVADLGAIQHPSIVLIRLGTYASQYPRTLEVSTSVDGSAWQPGWTGDTALLTYDAAVASPREIPLRIPLSGGAVRYLRLRQIGSDPGRGWSIVELQVMQ